MNLHFPPLNGGTVSGLNDAGIETFEGDFAKNVVRECAQNSLDAAADVARPVSIQFSRIALTRADLPFIDGLLEVLRASKNHWRGHDKAEKFFSNAEALAAGAHIDALRISDTGTTGVDGDDVDNKGRWFGLVKSRGVSNQKGSESGGAFGIGKDAPLAGSPFRTVLYSTRTLQNEVAFQGVCRLVTHKGIEDGELTQGTGFIGEFDSSQKVYRALRQESSIPEIFRRNDSGLDVWIIGSRHQETSWSKPFVRSALANFWPAIADGKISFRVGDALIDQSTLGRFMREERFDPSIEEAWPFYQSLVDHHAKLFKRTLQNAGQCRLHLLSAQRELPKKICMVRRTGMVIEHFSPRVGFLPYAGLFVCEGHEGNRLLRTLEPPRHDEWNPARAEEPRAAEALKEIKEWIREQVREQTPNFGEDQFNESEVPPDLLEDPPENPITDESNDENEPDLGGNPKEIGALAKVSVRTRTMRKTTARGNLGASGAGEDVDAPDDGDGKATGGRKQRKAEGDGGAQITPKTPAITTRAFCPSDGEGSVEMTIRCDGAYQGTIWIEALGDDGAAENIPLESAEIVDGTVLEVEQSKIKNVSFTAEEIVRLRLRMKNPGKYALRAHLT